MHDNIHQNIQKTGVMAHYGHCPSLVLPVAQPIRSGLGDSLCPWGCYMCPHANNEALAGKVGG